MDKTHPDSRFISFDSLSLGNNTNISNQIGIDESITNLIMTIELVYDPFIS